MVLVVLFALLVAPGLLIQICLGQRLSLFFAVVLSAGLFWVNVLVSHQVGGIQEILWTYAAQFVILLVWVLQRATSGEVQFRGYFSAIYFPVADCLAFLGIVSVVWTYVNWAGGFFEVPSDVYEHLSRVNYFLERLEQGVVDIYSPWHLLIALSLSLSGLTIDQALSSLVLILTVWLVTAFFLIGRELVSQGPWTRAQATLFGVLSAALVCITFGTSVFSFMRYYVLAPAVLTYPIYLFFALRIGRRLVANDCLTWLKTFEGCMFFFGLWVLYLFHRQEALFLLVFTVGGILAANYTGSVLWVARRFSVEFKKAYGVTTILLVCVIAYAAYVGMESVKDFIPLTNNTLDIGDWINSPYPLLIAAPTGRVYETVGLFGLGAIIMYFLLLPRTSRNFTLSLLAILPFVVVFNPIAVNHFVRFAGQDVVWRFTYMLPFGFLMMYTIFQTSNGFMRPPRKAVVGAVVGVGLLFELPGLNAVQQLRYETLAPVRVGSDYRLWSDMLDELRQFQHRHVLTDPVTGYVLTALTENRTFGFKFHGPPGFIDLNLPDYSPDSFSGYVGWLVVINQRNGEPSSVGVRSGHWPKTVMSVANHYSQALLDFLETNPRHFRRVWQQDGVTIYEIVEVNTKFATPSVATGSS